MDMKRKSVWAAGAKIFALTMMMGGALTASGDNVGGDPFAGAADDRL